MLKTIALSVIAFLLTAALPAETRAKELRVLASIKPLHALVGAVMDGTDRPELMVEGNSSPHGYALAPSEARKLTRADVIFWIGPGLETFLEKPIATLAPNALSVRLDSVEGLTRLALREGGLFEHHAHEHEDEHDEGREHDDDHAKDHKHEDEHKDDLAHEGEHAENREHDEAAHEDDHDDHEDAFDSHLWLDPRNAAAMVMAIAGKLSAADPARAERYRANAAATVHRLEDLEREIANRMAPLQARPFVVFHDGFHHFEHRFGLAAVGAITVHPEHMPGARRIAEIKEKIETLGAVCVFAEPQFRPKLTEIVTEGTIAKHGTLDPIGAALKPGPDLYFMLMRENAEAFEGCLSAGS